MPKSNLEEPPDRFQWSFHCLPAFDIWSLLGTGAKVRPENQTKNICSNEGEIPRLVRSNESIYFPLPCFLISYQKEYCFSAHRGSSTFWQLVIRLHPERVPMSHKANSAISKQRPSAREWKTPRLSEPIDRGSEERSFQHLNENQMELKDANSCSKLEMMRLMGWTTRINSFGILGEGGILIICPESKWNTLHYLMFSFKTYKAHLH